MMFSIFYAHWHECGEEEKKNATAMNEWKKYETHVRARANAIKMVENVDIFMGLIILFNLTIVCTFIKWSFYGAPRRETPPHSTLLTFNYL